MKLSVFHEFAAPEVLSQLGGKHGIIVDQASAPNPLVKDESEREVVQRNAKLFFDPATPLEIVEEALATLVAAGFEVVHRNPVTSAGCPMRDRVILRFASTIS